MQVGYLRRRNEIKVRVLKAAVLEFYQLQLPSALRHTVELKDTYWKHYLHV
jgi:hypothetical protein